MPAPQQMPCEPWTTEERVDCLCPDLADTRGPCADPLDPPVPATYAWTTEEIISIASRILFERTCRRFPGVCGPIQLRPCDPCRACGDCCECRYHYIPLAGPYPVTDVTEVKIDGVVIPNTAYRVDEYVRLVRTDGQLWPRWQDLGADPDATSGRTFVVRYMTGRPVPDDLQYAAALLACELKRACAGEKGCRLPDRVRSVVRDGVTYETFDPAEVANMGSFGNPTIDMILKSYPCGDKQNKPHMTTRLFHPLMDGERYDRSGVRG